MDICERCQSSLFAGQTHQATNLVKCLHCGAWNRLNEITQEWIVDSLATELATRTARSSIVEGRTELGPSVYEKPAIAEYFYEITRIDAVDEAGNEYTLVLHRCPNLEALAEESNPAAMLINYCGKVRKGETLIQSIARELKTDLGIERALTAKVLLGIEEFGNDRNYNLLPRCKLSVVVAYQFLPINNWKGVIVEWAEKNWFSELLQRVNK